MRLIAVALTVFVLALTIAMSARNLDDFGDSFGHIGQRIFRYDTMGDEQLWTGALRMHEAIATVSPSTALSVGLKVDVAALPPNIIAALKAKQVNLNDPAVTALLLRLNAVVGVMGKVNDAGDITSVGITCALCHSTVDNSFTEGIGRRLDGWANVDLDVGAIVALSPALDPALKDELNKWGPGKYDPRHHVFDGTRIITINTPSLPVDIPSIYGLQQVGIETYTGDGFISYWNSYVGVTQMGGHGSFRDRRLGLNIVQTPDLVTPKLPLLLFYQFSLKTPLPPAGSFDPVAASRGRSIFQHEARCGRCHRGPALTDVLLGPVFPFLHRPSEVGTEPRYAARSATGKYRTTPLRGLWQHAPYFHDGSAPDLPAVVDHYNKFFSLNLTTAQKADLVQFLKSL